MSATLAPSPAPAPLLGRDARACVRPGCGRRATTTLRFDYSERTVTLDPLGPDTEPGEYDLCLRHAARSTPPAGWTLRDRAPAPEPASEPAPPVGPDRGPGVARLAAALSAVPRAVSEDAPDAAPVGTDRTVDGPRRGSARLDGLLGPTSATPTSATSTSATPASSSTLPPQQPQQPEVRVRPVPLSERTPEVAVRPVPQPLRLAPDPTTTVWCADLLAAPMEEPVPTARDAFERIDRPSEEAPPTLFA